MKKETKEINIFLIRHARSLRNEKQAGNLPDRDVPLSDEGRRQASLTGEALAAVLSYARVGENSVSVWCSPYARTRETRAIMLEKIRGYVLDSREDERLIEWKFGLFDGLSKEERQAKYPCEAELYAQSIARDGKFYARPPLGESWQDVCQRTRRVLGAIVSEKPAQNIVIISHGLTIRGLVKAWMKHPDTWIENEPNPDNGSIRHLKSNNAGELIDAGYAFAGFPAFRPDMSKGIWRKEEKGNIF